LATRNASSTTLAAAAPSHPQSGNKKCSADGHAAAPASSPPIPCAPVAAAERPPARSWRFNLALQSQQQPPPPSRQRVSGVSRRSSARQPTRQSLGASNRQPRKPLRQPPVALQRPRQLRWRHHRALLQVGSSRIRTFSPTAAFAPPASFCSPARSGLDRLMRQRATCETRSPRFCCSQTESRAHPQPPPLRPRLRHVKGKPRNHPANRVRPAPAGR